MSLVIINTLILFKLLSALPFLKGLAMHFLCPSKLSTGPNTFNTADSQRKEPETYPKEKS